MTSTPDDRGDRSFWSVALQSPKRLFRIALLATLTTLAVAGWIAGGPWVVALYGRHMPRELERSIILTFLHAARWGIVACWLLAPLGAIVGFAGMYRAHARRGTWRTWGKIFVLCGSISLLIVPSELVAARWLRRLDRVPDLTRHFQRFPRDSSPERPLILAVLGGSTAEGHPYHPRVSLGLLVKQWLEPSLSGRLIEVLNVAYGGICLEQTIAELAKAEQRPDLLLLYAGHNEFQARYGWSREVRYYHDEGNPPGRSLVGLVVGRVSSVGELIERAIDRHSLDRPPPPRITRDLVDRPAFTSQEYRFLLADYRMRLNALLADCRRLGILPVIVVPAGNLADYPPARSYLAPETTAAERAAFRSAFETARQREDEDPDRALADYETLLSRHPTFAEGHYRLGRLLNESGQTERALVHLQRAIDLDGMPMRCPSDFQNACREIGRRHGAIVVDGPEVLSQFLDGKIPGEGLFHDAHHPTLAGHLALSKAVAEELATKLGVPSPTNSSPEPHRETRDWANALGIDREFLAGVCERTSFFWVRTAYMRYDPAFHLMMNDLYTKAVQALRGDGRVSDLGIPALRDFEPIPSGR